MISPSTPRHKRTTAFQVARHTDVQVIGGEGSPAIMVTSGDNMAFWRDATPEMLRLLADELEEANVELASIDAEADLD